MSGRWLSSSLRALERLPRPARVGPIGLDWAWDGLRAIQLEQRRSGLAVRAAFHAPWPEDRDALLQSAPALRELLRRSLRGGGFRGRRVVTAMPEAGVKLMVLGYQRGSGDPEDAAHILELVAERVRERLEDLVVDYIPVRTSGEKHGEKSALVAVAHRDEVIAHLERLFRAGLRVAALEIAPVAIRRLVDWASRASSEETILVIHADGPDSVLLVLWGRRLILYHEIEFTETDAIERVTKQLDLPAEAARSLLESHGIAAPDPTAAGDDPGVAAALREILKPGLYALAEEVRKAAIYTASMTHGAAIDRLSLVGAYGRWPGVAGFLGDALRLPVASLDPMLAFRFGAPATGASAAFATATGLALRDLGER